MLLERRSSCTGRLQHHPLAPDSPNLESKRVQALTKPRQVHAEGRAAPFVPVVAPRVSEQIFLAHHLSEVFAQKSSDACFSRGQGHPTHVVVQAIVVVHPRTR